MGAHERHEAEGREVQERLTTPGQIISRGKKTWLVRVFLGRDPVTGKRVYEGKTVHGTKKDAQGYLDEAVRRRDLAGTETAAQRTRMSELFEDLLSDYRINEQDYDWAERKVRLHLRPVLGALQARRLTTSAVKKYIARRQQEKAASATINRELALLKRALNLGREHTPPKVAQVPYIPMLQEHNVRKGFFEDEPFLKIRGAMPEFWARLAVTFAYYTGCRKGEILPLAWDQVDLLERVVRLEPGTTKNDEPRVIPLAPELYEMLVMQKAIRDRDYPSCPWVFFREGQPIGNHTLRDAWESACKTAGFIDEAGKATKLFHDLRRTGVRNLVRAGNPERVAMAISGHKTRSVFDRYNIVSEPDLKEAARRLGEYVTQKRADQTSRHTTGTQDLSTTVQ